jgi:phage terminase Nu1 subunit (DNA packaging protein)
VTNFPKTVSASDLSILLGVTVQRIGQLVDHKILRREGRGFNVADAVVAFIAHRESVVAAKHGVGDFGKARAALYLERARMARIKRETLEATLVPALEVIAFNTSIVGAVRSRMLSIPAKAASRLVGLKTASAAEVIVRAELIEGLEELSQLPLVAGDPKRRVAK